MNASSQMLSRAVVVGALVLCVGSVGVAVVSSGNARALRERLQQTETDLEQLKAGSSGGSHAAAQAKTLQKLLEEKDAAYIELQNKYDELKQQASTATVERAESAPAPQRADGGPGRRGNPGGQA